MLHNIKPHIVKWPHSWALAWLVDAAGVSYEDIIQDQIELAPVLRSAKSSDLAIVFGRDGTPWVSKRIWDERKPPKKDGKVIDHYRNGIWYFYPFFGYCRMKCGFNQTDYGIQRRTHAGFNSRNMDITAKNGDGTNQHGVLSKQNSVHGCRVRDLRP